MMSMRMVPELLGGAILLSLVAVANAATATITVAATRHPATPGPPPTLANTDLQMELCICMSTAEIQQWVSEGAPTITVTLPATIDVTENDVWGDDELGPYGASWGPGVWPVPMGTFTQGCPPGPPNCMKFGVVVNVPDSSYGGENPADFQLGAAGGQEGDVPTGTVVAIGTVGVTTTFPNRNN